MAGSGEAEVKQIRRKEGRNRRKKKEGEEVTRRGVSRESEGEEKSGGEEQSAGVSRSQQESAGVRRRK